MTRLASLFSSHLSVFTAAFLLRAILLVYGIYQDSVSALKYTDIDYYVFTDAARAVARHSSPYDRETYRYTPLLAWIMLPTTWGGLWFHFGKALFALSDLVAGGLILVLLKRKGFTSGRALKYAAVWLLNPMVANISTRGSSEGFLCVLVMALLWAFETRQIALSGVLLGLCVHFKIYPFIYGASMLWALESNSSARTTSLPTVVRHFFNADRISLVLSSVTTFSALNGLMYAIYGPPFLKHTFFHHLTRIDHRHNFSPYNTLLYLSSTPSSSLATGIRSRLVSFESLAFIPQLLLSTVLFPLALAKRDMPTTMLSQTLAFVAFNKVCTSQYFLWYLIFLPIYLPSSSLVAKPRLGVMALLVWVLGQAAWLQQGYQLEFLGKSTFVPGLLAASLVFFAVNCWILGLLVSDVAGKGATASLATVERKTHAISGKERSPSAERKSSTPTQGRADRIPASGKVDASGIGKVHLGPRHRTLKSTG